MTNRLAHETSPYLLQHADNPVDWWPWCQEALELARRLDRPILLSVGYAACHWCHVMAHESFEHEHTAEVMNRLFVNIKVDREERPDIDQIYQSAHHMLTQRSGGWPLTMFLTPDGTPFFGGTYYPKTARHGLPGFADLLERVADTFAGRRREIEEQNAAVRAALARASSPGAGSHHSDFGPAPLADLRDRLSAAYDGRFGGFGDAPKFPHPTDLEFMLHRWHSSGDEHARDIVLHTLAAMAAGGLFDQLGGGFYRYSTDDRWQIPHFEKMLYDNGPLLGLYAEAWQVSGDPLYRTIAEQTAEWLMRDMQDDNGGFYSSLDADSEGVEGRFYVWTRDEVKAQLPAELFAVVEPHWGLDAAPNFEHEHWHLAVAKPLEDVASQLDITTDEAASRLADARERLFAKRAMRVPPGLDNKILTSWNGLAIAGMMRAARVFDREDWATSARDAIAFVYGHHWRDERLYATSAGGEGRFNAYLDDHVFMIHGLLEAMQTRFEPAHLAFAEDLADALLENFEDRSSGGFFFTRHDHEHLIQRPKPMHDNATPAGNGMAARVLARLGHLTGETRYLDAAERGLQAFYGALARNPSGSASLALALAERLAPPAVIVLRGPQRELAGWQRRLATRHQPDAMVFALPPDTPQLPPALDKPTGKSATAWLCRGHHCLPPVTDIDALEAQLNAGV